MWVVTTCLAALSTCVACDPHSVARPDLVKTTHLYIELEADFERQIFSGKVVLSLKKTDPDANVLSLDVKNLTISSVRSAGVELSWELQEENDLGDSLEVSLGQETIESPLSFFI